MFSRNGALGPQKMLNSQKREKAAAKSFSQVVKAPETQQVYVFFLFLRFTRLCTSCVVLYSVTRIHHQKPQVPL